MASPLRRRAGPRAAAVLVTLALIAIAPVAAAAPPALAGHGSAGGLAPRAPTGTAGLASSGPGETGLSGSGPVGSVSTAGPGANLTVGGADWSSASVSGSVPSDAYASVTYDALDGEFVAFGGEAMPSGWPPVFTNETWTYKAGVWAPVCPNSDNGGGSSPCRTALPPARAGALLTYDSADSVVLMTGGEGVARSANGSTIFGYNDLWAFSDGVWQNWSSRGIPSGIWDGEMSYDPARGFVLAFTDSGATYSFNRTQNWTKMIQEVHPAARSHAAMYYDANRQAIILYGGVSPSGTVLNDTWEFKGGEWTKLLLGRNVPSDRVLGGGPDSLPMDLPAGYDAALSAGVLVDPTGDGGNSTWLFGPDGWTNDSANFSAAPPSGESGSLAFGGSADLGVYLAASTEGGADGTWLLSAPLRIATDPLTDTLDANETASLDPTLSNGLPPYTTTIGDGAARCVLGDPTTSQPLLTCPVDAPGSVNVSLTFTDAAGRSSNTTYRFTVHADPELTLSSVVPDPTSVGVPVHYGAQIANGTAPFTTLNWTFDDGTFTTGESATHAFATSGTHVVDVRARDATGFAFSVRYVVAVNPDPSVSLLENRSATDPGFPVAFKGTVDGGTGTTSCRWLFGDGTGSDTCDPSHAYGDPGTYRASFWTNDSVGAGANASLTVFVAAALAGTLLTSGTPAVGQQVGLELSPTGGIAPYTVAWTFGDGGTAKGTSVYHVYGIAGTYDVTATVSDSLGAVAVVNTSLSVDYSGSTSPGNGGGGSSAPSDPSGSLHLPFRTPTVRAAADPAGLALELMAATVAAALVANRTGSAGRGWFSTAWARALRATRRFRP